MNKRQAKKNRKKLLERYPFIALRNWRTDEIVDSKYTILDDIPEGWRRRFGGLMLEELRAELIRCNCMDTYRVDQVKEKYGTLCWYHHGYTYDCKVDDIVDKYETISENVCIVCGKPDVPQLNLSWVSPYCKKCYGKLKYYKAPYNDVCGDNPREIESYPSYEISTGNGWKKYQIDISDTVDLVRKKNWSI